MSARRAHQVSPLLVSPLLGPLLLGLLPLGGCRWGPADPPAPWEEVLAAGAAPVSTAGPLAYRLAVAPVEFGFAPTGRSADETTFSCAPDAGELRRQLILGLRAARSFERIEARGAGARDVAEVTSLAWEAQDDLVLQATLLDHRLSYLEHAHPVSWATLYLLWVLPAYWVPVDLFGCQLEVRLELRGVQGSRPPLLARTYKVEAQDREVAQELRPLDRGFVGPLDVFALWNVWTSLEEEHWRAIGLEVTPHAWRKALLAFLRDLEAEVGAPLRAPGGERSPVARRARKRFALVAGVERYGDARIGRARYAARDAEQVADWWASPEGGGLVRGRDLRVLLDHEATRAAVLGQLRELASRAAPGDELLVYLAGTGAVAPVTSGAAPAPLLWLADSEAAAPRSGLGLDEVAAILSSSRAGEAALLVDSSFGRPEADGGRTWRESAAPAQDEALARAFSGPGRACVLAAAPDEAAYTLQETEHGLFTSLLLRCVRQEGTDLDGDRRVSLPELLARVRAEVQSRAGLEGLEQVPRAYGPLERLELGWPR
ncbi:MAG: caspase family protein [Planctomycetota bacterium]